MTLFSRNSSFKDSSLIAILIALITLGSLALTPARADQAAELVFSGMDHYEKGEMNKAMADFTKCIDLGIDDPEVFFRMGHISETNKNYPEAAKYYLLAADRAEKHEPDNAIHALSYSNLGVILMKMKKTRAAEAAFTRAKKLSPANTIYLTNLAALYNSQKKFDMAIKCYNLLLLLEPDDKAVLLEKAASLMGMNETTKALNLLEKWPASDKNYNYSKFMMAKIFMTKGYFAKARELLLTLEKKKYNNPDIYVDLGLISQLSENNLQEAISYYRKYYAMGGKNTEVGVMIKKLTDIWKKQSVNKR